MARFWHDGGWNMKVYDFDDTIYDGDSSMDFLLFEGRRHPAAFLKAYAGAFFPTLRYLCGRGTKEDMKEHFFSLVTAVKDMDRELELFWNVHKSRVKPWYLQQQEPEDVVISASPYFLVKAGCDCIGISHVIATEMDPATGRINGFNCKGNNKPDRFRELFPEEIIQEFYSDSRSDLPMAKMAQTAYLVKGNTVTEWNK